MIRVNLLKNLGLNTPVAAVAGGFSGDSAQGAVSAEVNKAAGIKFCILLSLPLAIFGFEQIGLSAKQAELSSLNSQLANLEQEKASFGDLSPKITAFTEARRKAQSELDSVSQLASVRLREVKAIDAIQSLVPPKTWLLSIIIEKEMVRLNGYTLTEDGISELIRSLEMSSFFSRVEPKGTTQENLATGPVKKFIIEFKIGKDS